MDFQTLKNKNIIVTGALGKLGKEICKILYKKGVNIISIARLKEKQIEDYKSISLISDIYDCDVSKELEFNKAFNKILKEYKIIDGLITSTSYRPMKLGLDDTIENWNKSISQNSIAIFLPCREVGKIMCKQKYGSIINVSSIYGIGSPLKSLYDGTDITTEPDYPFIKGGTIALTKYLASFYAEFNVRVNAIAPGGIFNNQNPTFLSNYSKRVPLGRMAKEEDIVNLMLFLLSEESSYITGSVIPVDGGWSAT